MLIRTYTELTRYDSFAERFSYLKLNGVVGRPTFGTERYLNQKFYRSIEWKRIRDHVIARDLGMDLGVEGYEIYDKIIIHHMNPMIPDDLHQGNYDILDPEFLITTTHVTHNAIHYGDESLLPKTIIERRAGDTKLW